MGVTRSDPFSASKYSAVLVVLVFRVLGRFQLKGGVGHVEVHGEAPRQLVEEGVGTSSEDGRLDDDVRGEHVSPARHGPHVHVVHGYDTGRTEQVTPNLAHVGSRPGWTG